MEYCEHMEYHLRGPVQTSYFIDMGAIHAERGRHGSSGQGTDTENKYTEHIRVQK